MQLVNPLEQQNAVKTLYSEFVSPVCAKYGLTRIELDILLFLANNTRYDTATDIVEVRFLAKSQVSAAIKNLEARGCLRREYQLENRKTAHLRLCDPAQPMIAAGRSAQEQFGAALLDGFTPEELEHMQPRQRADGHPICVRVDDLPAASHKAAQQLRPQVLIIRLHHQIQILILAVIKVIFLRHIGSRLVGDLNGQHRFGDGLSGGFFLPIVVGGRDLHLVRFRVSRVVHIVHLPQDITQDIHLRIRKGSYLLTIRSARYFCRKDSQHFLPVDREAAVIGCHLLPVVRDRL